MVKLWKDEGYVEHFNKGLNEETESIKRIPIKSVERIISERKKELLSLLKDNKKQQIQHFYQEGWEQF